ncbi:MAG TPA: hypothetical protein VJT09_02005 [Pyrinomonadaceae bacterium]|nr:hypothetical protein [Pyrinomonadaceae bacterium]
MTTRQRRVFIHPLVALVLAMTVLAASAPAARADDPEFDAVTKHIKSFYKAKRVSIPFLGLANFFVKIIRPAGVKSFKVAIFEGLDFAAGANDPGLGLVLRGALSPEWHPLVRVRERDGEQLYVYAREAGENIKLMVVTIDRTDAVVARVKISPKRLSDFINNPKILGVSVNR